MATDLITQKNNFIHSLKLNQKNISDRPKLKHGYSTNDQSFFGKELNQIYYVNIQNLINSKQSQLKQKKILLKFKNKPVENSKKLSSSGPYENVSKSLIDVSFKSKKIDEKSKLIDQNRIKSNLYLSYLNYGSVNPFKSNYDIINKTNPEFYKKMSNQLNDASRFDRTITSLGLINHSLDYKKFTNNLKSSKRSFKTKYNCRSRYYSAQIKFGKYGSLRC